MNKLTSNFTLFWKIFFPVFFLTILYLFGFVLLFTENDAFFLFSDRIAKMVYWIVMILIFGFTYLTLFNLKRIEFDEEYFYITNYFKTIKVPLQAIEGIYLRPLPIIFSKVKLINKSTLGKNFLFIPDRVGVNALRKLHHHLIK